MGPGTKMLDFEVLQGDLDGDGRDEIIVVNFSGESQGMGQQYRDVAVLTRDAPDGLVLSSQFGVEEYGANGTFVRFPGEQRIRLFITEWEWNDQVDPERGLGLYLVGRWFEYRHNSLLPISGQPVLARRYLSSFERERLETLERSENPYAWFLNRKGLAADSDPMALAAKITSSEGIIEDVKVVHSGRSSPFAPDIRKEFKIRLESGRKIDVLFGLLDGDQLSLDSDNTFTRFGVADSKIVLPRTVEPTDVIGNLIGKPVTLSTLRGFDDKHIVRIMWIHNAQPAAGADR